MKFVLITNIFALFVCGALAGCLPFNRKLKKASSVPAMSTNSSFSDSAGPRSSTTSSKHPKRNPTLNTEFLAQFSVNGVPLDAKKYMHELSTFRHESAGMDSLWQQQDRQKQYRTKLAHFLAASASETLDAYEKANPQHTFGRSSSVVKDASASSSSNSYKSCKSSFNSSYKSCNSTINKSKSLNSSTSRSFSNASNNSNNSWASSRNASTSGYNNNPSNSFNTQSFTNYSKSVKSDGLRRSGSRKF